MSLFNYQLNSYMFRNFNIYSTKITQSNKNIKRYKKNV